MEYVQTYRLLQRLRDEGLLTTQIENIIDDLTEYEDEAATFAWTEASVMELARQKRLRPTAEQVSEILHDFQGTEWIDDESFEYYFDNVMSNAGRYTTADDLIWFLQDGYQPDGGPFETISELDYALGMFDTYQVSDGRVLVRMMAGRREESAEIECFSAPIDQHGNIAWREWRHEPRS